MEACQKQILESFTGKIVSVSLNNKVGLGENIILHATRGYGTMILQIVMALQQLKTGSVFFLEHDCLYNKSHFNFLPKDDNLFYYNSNNWRLDMNTGKAITYDGLMSLSGLCCNRLLALSFFKERLKILKEHKLTEYESDHGFFRKIGYEPKPQTEWRSEYPNIDIRHNNTFTRRKCKLTDFRKHPTGWKEITLSEISGWSNLKEICGVS